MNSESMHQSEDLALKPVAQDDELRCPLCGELEPGYGKCADTLEPGQCLAKKATGATP